ncbi:MAG: hypothetical protein Q7R93_02090 [bacterium]|nr:hypothetical protein [bacterium]
MSESIETQVTKTPPTTLRMWVSNPIHAFRLRTLRGVHENEAFLEAHDPQFKELELPKKRDEAYRFMNLQRNILWIVRFFALAGAGIIYYLLSR